MPEFDQQSKRSEELQSIIGRFVVTLISVFFTQFALLMVPHFFPISSLLPLLSLSVLVLVAVAGSGRCCKGLLGVRASAPAFVFINILFVWSVYMIVVRKAISSSLDITFNMELVMVVIGLCRILSSDPGFVTYGSSGLNKLVNSSFSDVEAQPESPVSVLRVRYCKYCKVHVKGFDHHCPAFGNCIGEKNHVLFIVLLVGFIISEASYVACSSQFAAKSHIMDGTRRKHSLSANLAISTMLFSLLQVLWQVVFLMWHIYCVCFNIKTDEWVNWKKYQEFQLITQIQPQPGQLITETRFTNPYNKGILQNLKLFLKPK
ncbi:hypothetical protein LguiB_031203 [Lonicera macranthoides]